MANASNKAQNQSIETCAAQYRVTQPHRERSQRCFLVLQNYLSRIKQKLDLGPLVQDAVQAVSLIVTPHSFLQRHLRQ